MAVAKVRDGGAAGTKGTNVNTVAATVPAAGHAAGNLVVAFCAYVGSFSTGGNTGTFSVTDTKGNTWTLLVGASSASSVQGARSIVFASVLATALVSGNTITFSRTVGSGDQLTPDLAVNTTEFSGVSLTTDGSATATGSSNSPRITAFSTTNALDLLLECNGVNGPTGDTFAEDTATYDGSTWTTLPRTGTTGGAATTNIACNSAFLITTLAGSVNDVAQLGTSRAWGQAIVALKAAATAPVTPHPSPVVSQAVNRSLTY